MKIAIINKSQLNNCWSPLQYTDSCHLCDKVMLGNDKYIPCKIKSSFHKKGVLLHIEGKKKRIMEEAKGRIQRLNDEKEKSLKIFE